MNEMDKLTELFMRFPGIGPRQARRFVFFLLRQDAGYRAALIRSIDSVAAHIQQCSKCLRYAPLHKERPVCAICGDTHRDTTQLMLVEKDTDVEQMEKSGAYAGHYFVLGGTLSLTGKKSYLREKELDSYLKHHVFAEIILALSTTSDGEFTTAHLAEQLKSKARITVLGRGLSTGSELEYADAATLVQALKNRA
tara:strand:+ start:33300 stop:33884 length:585 start_codon:yes stop_codon:yes gene_type:complete